MQPRELSAPRAAVQMASCGACFSTTAGGRKPPRPARLAASRRSRPVLCPQWSAARARTTPATGRAASRAPAAWRSGPAPADRPPACGRGASLNCKYTFRTPAATHSEPVSSFQGTAWERRAAFRPGAALGGRGARTGAAPTSSRPLHRGPRGRERGPDSQPCPARGSQAGCRVVGGEGDLHRLPGRKSASRDTQGASRDLGDKTWAVWLRVSACAQRAHAAGTARCSARRRLVTEAPARSRLTRAALVSPVPVDVRVAQPCWSTAFPRWPRGVAGAGCPSGRTVPPWGQTTLPGRTCVR